MGSAVPVDGRDRGSAQPGDGRCHGVGGCRRSVAARDQDIADGTPCGPSQNLRDAAKQVLGVKLSVDAAEALDDGVLQGHASGDFVHHDRWRRAKNHKQQGEAVTGLLDRGDQFACQLVGFGNGRAESASLR